jgi:lipoate-protein ligase A
MDLDLKLFQDFDKGLITSILRIYSWKPNCISLGYSQSIEKEIDTNKAALLGWDVVKRPTGGGIVFHNEAEVTYSLVTAIDNPLLPKGLVPSYKKISEAVVLGLNTIGVSAKIQSSPRHSLRSCHPSPSLMERGMNSDVSRKKGVRSLCFSYPAEYEIVANGGKIVGSAQKRGRKALLQQGSVFVRNTTNEALSVLKRRDLELNAVSVEEILGRQISFEELSGALINGFEQGLGIKFKI